MEVDVGAEKQKALSLQTQKMKLDNAVDQAETKSNLRCRAPLAWQWLRHAECSCGAYYWSQGSHVLHNPSSSSTKSPLKAWLPGGGGNQECELRKNTWTWSKQRAKFYLVRRKVEGLRLQRTPSRSRSEVMLSRGWLQQRNKRHNPSSLPVWKSNYPLPERNLKDPEMDPSKQLQTTTREISCSVKTKNLTGIWALETAWIWLAIRSESLILGTNAQIRTPSPSPNKQHPLQAYSYAVRCWYWVVSRRSRERGGLMQMNWIVAVVGSPLLGRVRRPPRHALRCQKLSAATKAHADPTAECWVKRERDARSFYEQTGLLQIPNKPLEKNADGSRFAVETWPG